MSRLIAAGTTIVTIATLLAIRTYASPGPVASRTLAYVAVGTEWHLGIDSTGRISGMPRAVDMSNILVKNSTCRLNSRAYCRLQVLLVAAATAGTEFPGGAKPIFHSDGLGCAVLASDEDGRRAYPNSEDAQAGMIRVTVDAITGDQYGHMSTNGIVLTDSIYKYLGDPLCW